LTCRTVPRSRDLELPSPFFMPQCSFYRQDNQTHTRYRSDLCHLTGMQLRSVRRGPRLVGGCSPRRGCSVELDCVSVWRSRFATANRIGSRCPAVVHPTRTGVKGHMCAGAEPRVAPDDSTQITSAASERC
jgi:hypothetical protein